MCTYHFKVEYECCLSMEITVEDVFEKQYQFLENEINCVSLYWS